MRNFKEAELISLITRLKLHYMIAFIQFEAENPIND